MNVTPSSTELTELLTYLEPLPEPRIVFDQGYRIVGANAAYRRQFGPQGSVIGRHCYKVSHHFDVPCDQAGESCPLQQARQSGQPERVLHLHHTPRGEEYVNIELTPLRRGSRRPHLFIEKMEIQPGAAGIAVGSGMVGRSPRFQAMLQLIARVAPSNASVLLQGESGTGKELAAKAVHDASARAPGRLVVVDCASLPESLFESELFGHEKGAFTGAHAAKAGLAESANGGTLFLDEVGDISLSMQVKLLRLLESGTFRRIGSTEPRRTDVRVISATHRDLQQMVAQGRFRQDLYYRLSTFPIHLPALRERAEDVGLIAQALLVRLPVAHGKALAAAALDRLQDHAFPGNVRELRNVLERAALLSDGDRIEAHHIGQALALGQASTLPMSPPPDATRLRSRWREQERQQLRDLLQSHRGSRSELAQRLGISVRSLYRRLQALETDSTSH